MGLSRRSSKNSKHSTNDTVRRDILLELNESEGFRSQENQIQKKNLSSFDSPLTIITRSANVRYSFYPKKLIIPKTTSYVSNLNIRNSTKTFYERLEKIIIKNNLKGEINLQDIKNIVYRDLDDLAAKEEEIDLGKKIGNGASSEVFYGNFKFCPCAVKKIKMSMMNAKQINFIVSEIACLKKLRHPNIVMIIGVLIDQEDNLMIITELCEQESIKKFLTKFQKKAPLNVKMRILFDIAKAIYYMHESEPQIIHRDLKPENIFLTADLKAKIGDFG